MSTELLFQIFFWILVAGVLMMRTRFPHSRVRRAGRG